MSFNGGTHKGETVSYVLGRLPLISFCGFSGFVCKPILKEIDGFWDSNIFLVSFGFEKFGASDMEFNLKFTMLESGVLAGSVEMLNWLEKLSCLLALKNGYLVGSSVFGNSPEVSSGGTSVHLLGKSPLAFRGRNLTPVIPFGQFSFGIRSPVLSVYIICWSY
ncbi:hypothetical protein SO802_006171 [Lithocarpus litseifolius]|uniref:Uncharacterized protein n=1 Tax=Lithocarpus litseifolius TaxID=425828 RepID=A0AAW2DNA6_9ROSI